MPTRALIAIDIQQEYFDGALAIQYPPREESLAHILEAIDTARDRLLTVVVRHESPKDAPVFAAGSPGWELHPEIAARKETALEITKRRASAFAGTGLAEQLRDRQVDTVTLIGYMTNNCVLATAVDCERLGFTAEVLSDATGATHLANEAGYVPAHQVQETLLTLFQSNFAAVASTQDWVWASKRDEPLPKDNLIGSALRGSQPTHQRPGARGYGHTC